MEGNQGSALSTTSALVSTQSPHILWNKQLQPQKHPMNALPIDLILFLLKKLFIRDIEHLRQVCKGLSHRVSRPSARREVFVDFFRYLVPRDNPLSPPQITSGIYPQDVDYFAAIQRRVLSASFFETYQIILPSELQKSPMNCIRYQDFIVLVHNSKLVFHSLKTKQSVFVKVEEVVDSVPPLLGVNYTHINNKFYFSILTVDSSILEYQIETGRLLNTYKGLTDNNENTLDSYFSDIFVSGQHLFQSVQRKLKMWRLGTSEPLRIFPIDYKNQDTAIAAVEYTDNTENQNSTLRVVSINRDLIITITSYSFFETYSMKHSIQICEGEFKVFPKEQSFIKEDFVGILSEYWLIIYKNEVFFDESEKIIGVNINKDVVTVVNHLGVVTIWSLKDIQDKIAVLKSVKDVLKMKYDLRINSFSLFKNKQLEKGKEHPKLTKGFLKSVYPGIVSFHCLSNGWRDVAVWNCIKGHCLKNFEASKLLGNVIKRHNENLIVFHTIRDNDNPSVRTTKIVDFNIHQD